MKKIFIFCMFVFCISLSAQKTSLIVDNQTPGWLSSKIGFGDQQTLQNLKVTGYVNSADMELISNLMGKYNLHGHIDLSDCQYVDANNSLTNIFPENAFRYSYGHHIQKISLPKLMKVGQTGCIAESIHIDTLVAGGINMPEVDQYCFQGTGGYTSNLNFKHLILREGVKRINTYAFSVLYQSDDKMQLKSISMPNSLRYIASKAFYNCDSLCVTFSDSIEKIEYEAFGRVLNSDTLYLPKHLKHFSTGAFERYKVLYFGEDLETIDNLEYHKDIYGNYFTTEKIDHNLELEIHISALTPPSIQTKSPDGIFNNTIVYVPKESEKLYKSKTLSNGNVNPWAYAKKIVTVSHVENVKIDGPTLTYVGDNTSMTAKITPIDALNKDVIWSSSNEEVAKIDENGVLTANEFGTTQIKVMTKEGNFTDSVLVKVFKHTTGIEIPRNLSIVKGEKVKIDAHTLPLIHSDGRIKWECSNSEILDINENGEIEGLASGTCMVTGTTVDGGFVAVCEITVIQPVETITLEKHVTSLNIGEEEQLIARITPTNAGDKTMIWISKDPNIVSVDPNGLIKALGSGRTKIVVCSNQNQSLKDSCFVTVAQPVTGITLDKNQIVITEIGNSVQLIASIQPENATNKRVNWSSSNPNVCLISDNGTIVGLQDGKSVIVATTEDGGFVATCNVEVNTTTGINDITMELKNVEIYSVDGIKRTNVKKGINIVKTKDNKIKKVFLK